MSEKRRRPGKAGSAKTAPAESSPAAVTADAVPAPASALTRHELVALFGLLVAEALTPARLARDVDHMTQGVDAPPPVYEQDEEVLRFATLSRQQLTAAAEYAKLPLDAEAARRMLDAADAAGDGDGSCGLDDFLAVTRAAGLWR